MHADGLGHVLPVEQHPLRSVLPELQGDLQLRQQAGNGLRVLLGNAPPAGSQPHRAVNGSGVHMEKPQLPGQLLGQGGFPRAGGSVNGNTEMLSAHSCLSFQRPAAATPAAWPVAHAI